MPGLGELALGLAQHFVIRRAFRFGSGLAPLLHCALGRVDFAHGRTPYCARLGDLGNDVHGLLRRLHVREQHSSASVALVVGALLLGCGDVVVNLKEVSDLLLFVVPLPSRDLPRNALHGHVVHGVRVQAVCLAQLGQRVLDNLLVLPKIPRLGHRQDAVRQASDIGHLPNPDGLLVPLFSDVGLLCARLVHHVCHSVSCLNDGQILALVVLGVGNAYRLIPGQSA
uniref:Uncharacterized protein n=1 Tax=uncultured marine virus TaxID=186617 RepID=A0A0F7L3A1_9VIRU|nr:hypothetical protein [uncultured marine virus]